MSQEHDIESEELLERIPLQETTAADPSQGSCLSMFFPLSNRVVESLRGLLGLEGASLFSVMVAQVITYQFWQNSIENYENLACNTASYLHPDDCLKLGDAVTKNLDALRAECWVATGLFLSLVINAYLLLIDYLIERNNAQASNQPPSQRLGSHI